MWVGGYRYLCVCGGGGGIAICGYVCGGIVIALTFVLVDSVRILHLVRLALLQPSVLAVFHPLSVSLFSLCLLSCSSWEQRQRQAIRLHRCLVSLHIGCSGSMHSVAWVCVGACGCVWVVWGAVSVRVLCQVLYHVTGVTLVTARCVCHVLYPCMCCIHACAVSMHVL